MTIYNSNGNYRTTIYKDQSAFDMLPPSVRHALNYSCNNFAADALLKRGVTWKNGARAAELLTKWDRELVMQDAAKVWGPDYLTIVYGVKR